MDIPLHYNYCWILITRRKIMERLKKASAATGLALLIVFLACGCSLFLQDDLNTGEQTGWYIKLNIHQPPASKAISVSEYEVTGLVIKVRDPADELIRTIKWEVAEGSTSYKIPVTQQGLHKIVVTHIGKKDSQVVEAKESAMFNIQPMVITVIDLIPGCIGLIRVEAGGEAPPPSIVGAWWLASATVEGGTATDCTLTFKEDGSWVQTYEQGGGSNLQTGTFSPPTMPANTTLTATVATSSGPSTPTPGSTYLMRYSNLTATTADLEVDVFLNGWDGPFTLQRQTSSIVGTWSCASMGPMTAVVMTINADTSFALAYQTSSSNTQTGAFHPYTMNADTDLTATVATSSGPDVPTPGSTWLLKYANLTASTVEISIQGPTPGWQGPYTCTRS
jgi:hypothetical protein